ncbi:delta(24)-sterol reductase-like [Apostichopus japonicus]|uniref:delta(24)-sterol reductase-like n=1 Tax=Stichopus japonicus TaxID=307972 RepID=UPI003AB29BC6
MLWLSLGTGLLSSFMLFSYVKGTEHMMKHYRWVFVCFGLLPISLVYSAVFNIRNWIVFKLKSAPKNHKSKVEQVSKQIKDWRASGSKQKLCTSRASWESHSLREGKYKKTDRKINLNLVDILEINTEKGYVRAEAMATIGELTATLIPMGWTVPVIPELDDCCVGGLVMGSGVESTSHKYGLFQHICKSFEIVLATGEVKRCSKDENSDLFYSVPWSCGTLGFLVSADILIVPSKKYVRLEYYPAKTREEVVRVFKEQTLRTEGNEFVEGLMYNENEAVIMTGSQTDDAEPDKINKIGNFYKPWFYKHVEGILKTGYCVEYIPLRDYYHRHSRSIFWEMQDIIPFGNNVFFRYLFGWLVPPKISLLKLTQTDTLRELYRKHHLVQDIFVPLDKMEDTLKFIHKEMKMYPLWLCPFVLPNQPGMFHPPGDEDGLYIDIGAFGTPKAENYSALKTIRKLEEYEREVNGFQMLYADCHMTREEFRDMFDHTLYDKLRKELKCEDAFPEVYDKISKDARY